MDKMWLTLSHPARLFRLVMPGSRRIEFVGVEAPDGRRIPAYVALEVVWLHGYERPGLKIEDDAGHLFFILLEDIDGEFSTPVAQWRDAYPKYHYSRDPVERFNAMQRLEAINKDIRRILLRRLQTYLYVVGGKGDRQSAPVHVS